MKYHSPNTDLAALQRELAGSGKSSNDTFDEDDGYLDEADEDADLDEDEDNDAGNGNWAARRR